MGDISANRNIGDSGVIELTGKIMMVAIVLLLFIVVFVFCIHLYARWFWYRHQENATTSTATTRQRRRLDFAPGQQEIVVVQPARRGLDPSALNTMPVLVYNPKEFKDGLECAVCLCELAEGEKARILPKCNHGFHLECINMWFQSHPTCPLCRNPVSDQNQQANSCSGSTLETIHQAHPRIENSSGAGGNNFSTEAGNFPTNVLIWGDETSVSTLAPENHFHQVINNNAIGEPSSSSSSSSSSMAVSSVSSRPDGALVIEIPRQINEDEEQKSPMPTRLRSLKRLLSGNNRRVNPSSPRILDSEQGGGRVQS